MGTETQRDSRHGHGKALDNHIVVERLQDISGDQRMINTSVLVGVQACQLLLSYVYHPKIGGVLQRAVVMLDEEIKADHEITFPFVFAALRALAWHDVLFTR